MTSSPAVETKPIIEGKRIWRFQIRKVLVTTDRQGKSLIEIAIPNRDKLLVYYDDKAAMEMLEPVGLTTHDGGKFFKNNVLLALDEPVALSMEIEILYGFGGTGKLNSVKPLAVDADPAADMPDEQFFKAWDAASHITPPLERVSNDLAMWCGRLKKIVTEFYGANGYGREAGLIAGQFIKQQVESANAKGNIHFAQDALKKRLRADFPGGKPMAKKDTAAATAFDRSGSAADIGLRIIEEQKKRKLSTGPDVEVKILGEKAERFVTTIQTYKSALTLVEHHYANVDEETEFLLGISKNEAEVGKSLTPDELNSISDSIQIEHTAGSTESLLGLPGYDRSLILAAHRSAIEAYNVRDVPRFENGGDGAKAQSSDFDVLHQEEKTPPWEKGEGETTPLSKDEIEREKEDMRQTMGEPTPPITAPPAEKPAEPAPKFTADDWSKWLADQKQDYPELKPADIMQILGIARASEWMPHTLKDAAEKLKRAVEIRRADALLEDAKRILKDKDVPLEEWPKIIVEAGEPRLFTDTSYSKTNYQGKILTLANAYITLHASPPKVESAMVPVDPNPPQAIVPAQPPGYAVLTALKLPTPAEMQVMLQLAAPIAESHLFAGVDSVPRAIAIMLKALQWNIGAIDGFENFYVFPTQRGDVIYPSTKIVKARVIAHPKCKRFDVTGDDTKATAIVWREGDDAPVSFTYTVQEAETAGLLEKKNWKTNKADMLKYRVSRRAIYEKFPDLALGLNDDEE